MTAIIFDFDGTIADSFDIFLEILRVIAPRLPQLTAEEIIALRKLSTRALIQKLGIRPWQVPLLLVRGRREISARMERVPVFEGMPEVLGQLSSHYTLYIASTNSPQNIAKFLARYQLSGYIQGIYGNIGLMGKAASLKRLLAREGIRPSECWYVGDETRDIEAARKMSLRSAAVSWGYNHPDALRASNPDVLAETPRALLAAITRTPAA